MSSIIHRVQQQLASSPFEALLLSSPSNITYVTNLSLFSTHERDAFFLITHTRSYLFTHALYIEEVKKQVQGYTVIEITREKPISLLIKDVLKTHTLRVLAFEETSLTVAEYLSLKKDLAPYRLTPSQGFIQTLRMTKSKSEIHALQKAITLGDDTFSMILHKIKPGISEQEVAFEMEYYIKKQGAEVSFPTIVAFGPNASVPHHQVGRKKVKNHDGILIDFGIKFNNYCSDMTRTVCLGNPTDEFKKMYDTVYISQQKSIDLVFAGQEARKVDQGAREYILSQNFPTIPHSLGHGVGIDVHEMPRLSPKSRDILENNMAFTIEPGIYIPAVAGIRIEDIIVLEKNTVDILTHAPKYLITL